MNEDPGFQEAKKLRVREAIRAFEKDRRASEILPRSSLRKWPTSKFPAEDLEKPKAKSLIWEVGQREDAEKDTRGVLECDEIKNCIAICEIAAQEYVIESLNEDGGNNVQKDTSAFENGTDAPSAETTVTQVPDSIFTRMPKTGDRDYIGFATLPEQIHRKSVKRGFDFTLMVVGESGLGKSTLINSLFLSDLYKDRKIPDAAERVEKTTCIEKKTMDIEERGVKLRLTVVDTPGFGDALNSEDSWKVCVNYIDDQFRQYFTDESGLNRKNIVDNRVHCCLYFIPPWGHGLRQIDVELMKRLHQKVNIVPVIAKADTLTAPEVKKLKQRILSDIEENNIQIYQFPECDSDEDEEFKQQDRELKASLPFSVIGSNTVIEVGGTRVRGRQYPWGVVEVENPKHSDFNKLRNMLITTHMQDLKDVTEDVHYENFRAQCISQISQQAIRERGKLKRDSVVPLEGGITETDRLLLQKDEEIRRMQDMLAQMQQKLKATGQSNDNIVNI
ncbi:septin-2 isoform X2 [Cimex lectularius]|uniref:Septin-type G domain-containing protein n=1 Tax=Cimex lectularius TaxID=79782 RepID=A0A8I6S501_CIMLE|nr:septin-2 isoform X2 [Cimex lectularius]